MIPINVENRKGRDMAKTLSSRMIAAVTLFVVTAALAGCQQPTPNEKQARLLAAENAELKQKLARTETQQKQQAKKLQQTEWELSKCRSQADLLQRDLEKGVTERAGDVTAKVIDENARLRKEIQRLQSELKKPKAEPN
jgi:hypothetical protein